ncbi:MAG: hypothetical protein NTY15_16120 [Planctomycetota bacterium]|nr:hypothetical protein [Planctomycetota bacterium]
MAFLFVCHEPVQPDGSKAIAAALTAEQWQLKATDEIRGQRDADI